MTDSTGDDMAHDPQQYLVACHEAGHAVAVLMRGGEMSSVTIEPTDEYLGLTHASVKSASDGSFAIYAGPWAEARLKWPLPTLDDHDNGKTFDDYVEHAWWENFHGDGRLYMETLDLEEGQGVLFNRQGRELFWSRELETRWPVIQAVVEMLMKDRTVTAEAIEHLLDTTPPTGTTETS